MFYLTKDFMEIYIYDDKIENLNNLISDYLIKKKINIREVEVKLRNEELRKEKEELKIRKNLEDKIDDALEKANNCLNNIKSFGKINPIITKGQKQLNIKELEKKDEKDPINIIISKIKNKYNNTITVNENNMNDYFLNMAKIRNQVKIVKNKNKILQNKSKNLKKIFNQVFSKSKIICRPDSTDFTFYKMINFNYVDLLYKLISIIKTELFEKLFLKLMYCDHKYFGRNKQNIIQSEYMSILQDTF